MIGERALQGTKLRLPPLKKNYHLQKATYVDVDGKRGSGYSMSNAANCGPRIVKDFEDEYTKDQIIMDEYKKQDPNIHSSEQQYSETDGRMNNGHSQHVPTSMMNTVNFNIEGTDDNSNMKTGNHETEAYSEGITPQKLTLDSNTLAKYNKPNNCESHFNSNESGELRAPPNLQATADTVQMQDLTIDLMNNNLSKTAVSKYSPFVLRNKKNVMRIKGHGAYKSHGKGTFFGAKGKQSTEKMGKSNYTSGSIGKSDSKDVLSEHMTQSFTDEPGTEPDMNGLDKDIDGIQMGNGNMLSESQNFNMAESKNLHKYMEASQNPNPPISNQVMYKIDIIAIVHYNSQNQIEKKIALDETKQNLNFSGHVGDCTWLENIPNFEEISAITSAYMMQRWSRCIEKVEDMVDGGNKKTTRFSHRGTICEEDEDELDLDIPDDISKYFCN